MDMAVAIASFSTTSSSTPSSARGAGSAAGAESPAGRLSRRSDSIRSTKPGGYPPPAPARKLSRV